MHRGHLKNIKMKKTIISILAFVAITLQSFAEEKKKHIGFSLGPSFPIGDFGSKDAYQSNSGLAKTGVNFDFSFAYQLGVSNFGITGLYLRQTNKMDGSVIQDGFTIEEPEVNWNVSTGYWSSNALMAGGFGSFPISSNATFDIRAMLGWSVSTSPKIEIMASQLNSTSWSQEGKSIGFSVAYLVGAGFKFDLGSKLYLLTNADFFGSHPTFKTSSLMPGIGYPNNRNSDQKMTTVNLSVGLAFKI